MENFISVKAKQKKEVLNQLSQGKISLDITHLKVKHLIPAGNLGLVCSQQREEATSACDSLF